MYILNISPNFQLDTCHKKFHEVRLAFNTGNLPKYSFFHYSNYTFAACTVKTKKNRKNIHKIKQLAWGSGKFIGTIVISDQFISLLTPIAWYENIENLKLRLLIPIHALPTTSAIINQWWWMEWHLLVKSKISSTQTTEWSWYILCSNSYCY